MKRTITRNLQGWPFDKKTSMAFDEEEKEI